MKKSIWISFALGLAVAPLARAFMLRDQVSCLWPAKPVQIDGRAREWSETPVLEEEGFSFRAMNDASTLYLLIRGEDYGGGMILSGRYRQNVTLWFVKPDESARAWGLNLDFSQAHPPEVSSGPVDSPAITFSSVGVAPEWVTTRDLELSTATLPSGIEMQGDLSHKNGQQPIYEIGIPLSMITRRGDSILADFVTTEVSPDVMARLQAEQSGQRPSGGGRHGHGGGGSRGGGNSPSMQAPSPLDLHLEIVLTKEPNVK